MISPLVPKDADLRSYTWIKLDYSRLFASEFFAMANDAEFRAAFILWCKSMQQLPAGSLPNNDKVLAGWCGKSLKQWAKIKDMALHGWQEADDGRLYHPVLAEVVNDILFKTDAKATSNDQDDKETKKPMTNAERQAAHKARQKEKELALLAEKSNGASNGTGNEEVTLGNGNSNGVGNESNATGNGQVTASNGNFVTSEGGKGGDLDLNLEKDLDLDQYINTNSQMREAEKKSSRFFDDELRPDLNALNAKLGANLITQKFIDENLFSFNSHYETQQLTDNQRLAKWINWFKSEEAKKQAQTIQRPNKTQPPKNPKVFGNVNDAFPLNPDDRPLTAAEKAEIARMLEEDEHVVF